VCWYEYFRRAATIKPHQTVNPDFHDAAYGRALRRWISAAKALALVQRTPVSVFMNVAGPTQVSIADH
jgi:hypothetical protein